MTNSGVIHNAPSSLSGPFVPNILVSKPSNDEAVVKYVLDRYHAAARFDRPFKEQALEHWKLFRNILPEDWPYFTRFFEPEVQTAVWDACEGILLPFFNKQRAFDLEPVEQQDELQTEMMRVLMDFVLREFARFKASVFGQVFESILYGNGVLKHTIRNITVVEKQWIRNTADAFGSLPSDMIYREVRRLEAWPVRQLVSRFDCYPAPTGATIQEMPYFIERIIMPLDAAKRHKWTNTDKLIGFCSLDSNEGRALGGEDFNEQHWDLFERLKAVGYDVRDGDYQSSEMVKYCEILAYTESPPGEPGGARIILIGDRRALLYDSARPTADNPTGDYPFIHRQKPYSEIKFAPAEQSVWQADGLVKQIEHLQVKINTRASQIGDIIERITKPTILYGPAAGVKDPSDLEQWPGSIIRVDGDPAAVMEQRYQGVPADAWSDLNFARLSIQRHGGASDYGRGVPGMANRYDDGSKTFGGIQLLLSAAQMARSFKWRLAEEQGINDGLNMDAMLIQQFMTVPQKLRIIGENRVLQRYGYKDYVVVMPEDISGRWNFYAVGASSAMDNVMQADILVRAAREWAQIPTVASRVKWRDVAVEAAELIGIRNPDRFFMTDEEFQRHLAEEGDPASEQLRLKLIQQLILKFEQLPPSMQVQIAAMAGLQPPDVQEIVQYMEMRKRKEKAYASTGSEMPAMRG